MFGWCCNLLGVVIVTVIYDSDWAKNDGHQTSRFLIKIAQLAQNGISTAQVHICSKIKVYSKKFVKYNFIIYGNGKK